MRDVHLTRAHDGGLPRLCDVFVGMRSGRDQLDLLLALRGQRDQLVQ
jgi:hypothetical protein